MSRSKSALGSLSIFSTIDILSPRTRSSAISWPTSVPTPNSNRYWYQRSTRTPTSTALPVTRSLFGSLAEGTESHFLVRIAFLRCFALVNSVVFLIAYRQNKALVGDDGITPARNILDAAERRGDLQEARRQGRQQDDDDDDNDAASNKFLRHINRTLATKSATYRMLRSLFWDRTDASNRILPTILWALSPSSRRSNIDPILDLIAITGLTVSFAILLLGAANVPAVLALYICQRSLMAVGGPWFQYGWESQLAEVTFLTIFTVPLLSLDSLNMNPVPLVPVWAMRWLLFRVMIGAGLIKFRSGDPKWRFRGGRMLSTTEYFYETQPVPNTFSRFFHRLPRFWHRFEVLGNHFVELVVPWFLLMPNLGGYGRRWRIWAGMIQIVFQGTIIMSGNLSFLNWLTMLPALYCFDDAFLSKLFPPGYQLSTSVAAYTNTFQPKSILRSLTNTLLFITLTKLSIPVVKNLLSKTQIMNGSFDRLQLVNTYGAFGRVAEEREELIVSSAEDYRGPWKEYQFCVKPGDVRRRPRWVSPYHHRLDWQMWIAACLGRIERSPWMYSFLWKLLREDEGVLRLLECNPWAREDDREKDGGGEEDYGGKPRYIRVERYKYRFNKNNGGDYWVREKIGNFFPKQGICTEAMLEDIIVRG